MDANKLEHSFRQTRTRPIRWKLASHHLEHASLLITVFPRKCIIQEFETDDTWMDNQRNILARFK